MASLFGVTPIASTTGVSSLVLKNSPGMLVAVTAVNLTSTAGFLVVINATSAPSNGATIAPLEFVPLMSNGYTSIYPGASGIPDIFSTGIVALVTSAATPYTYTTGAITAAISGRVQ